MEEQAETMLSGLLGSLNNYPDPEPMHQFSSRSDEAASRTARRCLENGGWTSTMKDVGGKLIGCGQSISGFFVRDEVMKAALGIYVRVEWK
jgi:ferritin-like metal-binding protein YciE